MLVRFVDTVAQQTASRFECGVFVEKTTFEGAQDTVHFQLGVPFRETFCRSGYGRGTHISKEEEKGTAPVCECFGKMPRGRGNGLSRIVEKGFFAA